MLVDDVTITVKAGNGGKGAVSFRRNEGNPRGGPDGGNGGNGGNVYVEGTTDYSALQQFQYKKLWKAEDGVSGARKNLFGRSGNDLIIRVPVGTLVGEVDESKEQHELYKKIRFEITNDTEKLLVARGGVGGRGNNEFKSATNQVPREFEYGEPGEEKQIHLSLRLIADIGLIGLPNAGKSSLLAALTNAHPKIGNYPFTTLEPNLGVMDGLILADIPGLIEGASNGKGLGIKFLKHIEKTQLLVHCIDVSQENLVKTYETVRHEFTAYNTEVLKKRELIVLTKIDLVDKKALEKAKRQFTGKKVLTVSIYDKESRETLKQVLQTMAS